MVDEVDISELNPVHEEIIYDFLRLSNFQQAQRIKSVNLAFNDHPTLQTLSGGIYTGEELKNLICEIQENVITEMQTELTDSGHTTVLLIQQLLKQAQDFHLTLKANISELENREKLNMVKEYEELLRKTPEKLSITVTKPQFAAATSQNLGDLTLTTILKEEMNKIKKENADLRIKIQGMEELAQAAIAQNAEFARRGCENDFEVLRELESAQEEIRELKNDLERSQVEREEMQTIQNSVDKMTKELKKCEEKSAKESGKLKKDLEEREEKLRKIQSNLLLTEKELEKKFQATGAYANMKKILQQKNDSIKELRRKLGEYEAANEKFSDCKSDLEAENDDEREIDETM